MVNRSEKLFGRDIIRLKEDDMVKAPGVGATVRVRIHL